MRFRSFTQLVAAGLLSLSLVGCSSKSDSTDAAATEAAAVETEASAVETEASAVETEAAAVETQAAAVETEAAAAAFDAGAAALAQLGALPEGFKTIKADALKEQLAAAPPVLVDLRDATEIGDSGYIEGAISIPIRELAKNLDKLPDLNQSIVVYCASGHRGGIAVQMLSMLGYTNVKSLAGGIPGWTKAEFPVVKGEIPAATAGTAPAVDAAALAAVNAYVSALPEGFGTIKVEPFKEQLAAAAPFVLDVREMSEVTEVGSIEGAVHVPVREVPANLDKLPAKDAPIVVLCASGHRGALTMTALQMSGYTNVKNLAGGMNAWVAASFPVVK